MVSDEHIKEAIGNYKEALKRHSSREARKNVTVRYESGWFVVRRDGWLYRRFRLRQLMLETERINEERCDPFSTDGQKSPPERATISAFKDYCEEKQRISGEPIAGSKAEPNSSPIEQGATEPPIDYRKKFAEWEASQMVIRRTDVTPEPVEWEFNGFIASIIIIALFVVLGPIMCSPSSNRTDGVFESAQKKIDSGRGDELTARERQRINDLINWCKKCNKPLRMCPHG